MYKPSLLRQSASWLGWTRQSFYLLVVYSWLVGMIACCTSTNVLNFLVRNDGGGHWHTDLALLGLFIAMFLLTMAKVDLRSDAKIILAGLVGGLIIECWGTQTNLWFYYTTQRPPPWVMPAWAISSLAIDRLARFLDWMEKAINHSPPAKRERWFRVAYWVIFSGFYVLLLRFASPTLDKSLTCTVLILCALIIVTPINHRWATLTFLAGSGLGYCIEWWGTTHLCWTYYTHQTPPLFAVLAHGMACVVFWRARMASEWSFVKITKIMKEVRIAKER
jgi:hypothetical protein